MASYPSYKFPWRQDNHFELLVDSSAFFPRMLAAIDAGWADIGAYDYQREDTKIHIMRDGQSALSYSTITENMVQNGEKMTSKFREYATYELENGKPVITQVSGHTLVGDTMPVPEQQSLNPEVFNTR